MALSFECQHDYPTGFELRAQFTAPGGVTALVGPSGSGKTTILSILAGLLRPRQGLIRLGDRILCDTQRGVHVKPEQRGIGMVFQDLCLFPHLSVRQNLQYGTRWCGPDRLNFDRAQFDRVVQMLQIDELLDRQPHTLSGGQRQRVALGRALLRGPQLLLLDEPLSALDQPLQDRIVTYLERVLAEYPLPTLLVTHHLSQVRRLASQVLCLQGGQIMPATADAEPLHPDSD